MVNLSSKAVLDLVCTGRAALQRRVNAYPPVWGCASRCKCSVMHNPGLGTVAERGPVKARSTEFTRKQENAQIKSRLCVPFLPYVSDQVDSWLQHWLARTPTRWGRQGSLRLADQLEGLNLADRFHDVPSHGRREDFVGEVTPIRIGTNVSYHWPNYFSQL